MQTHRALAVSLLILIAGCSNELTEHAGEVDGELSSASASASASAGRVWSSFSTTETTLTVVSAQNLVVNAPFYGIEVRKNGIDITDDIVDVTAVSPQSWRYTFGTAKLNAPRDTIGITLKNAQLAEAGHYVAVRESAATGNTPESMYQLLEDCQTGGRGACVGDAPIPGLLTAVKGISRRYEPRALQTLTGYDFSPVFDDAAFLATKGKKLHVVFTVRTFATKRAYSGDGGTKAFDIPAGWDKGRDREVHVYVDDKDTPFAFNGARTQVLMSSAPAKGSGNVVVMYARDPFPETAWHLTPPVGGWYEGSGVNYGFDHAPWRSTCVAWTADFMRAFRAQWTAAIAKRSQLASAIDAISVQETANGLGGAGYSEGAYRAGLVEYAKIYARAVRGRAIHGQLINQIAGGGAQSLADLAVAIVPWGSRLEGPDLFNDDTGSGNAGLEFGVYERVHREQHDLAPTMIWAQNNSYAELKPRGGFFTMKDQFEKAQKAVTDSSTAGGHPGLEAESVFWNMTLGGSGSDWKDALPVIAAHPVIQTTGNDRNLWRLEKNKAKVADQSLSRVNP